MQLFEKVYYSRRQGRANDYSRPSQFKSFNKEHSQAPTPGFAPRNKTRGETPTIFTHAPTLHTHNFTMGTWEMGLLWNDLDPLCYKWVARWL